MHKTLVAAALILLAGCGTRWEESSLKRETNHQSLDKPKADLVQVELAMAAGKMILHGGAAAGKLMEADFITDFPAWKPELRYDASSFRGKLRLRQPGSGASLNGHTNEWSMKFAEDIPLSLDISVGAGESELELGALTLRDVEVKIGAGRCEVDLRGMPKRSYEVRLSGGVGEAVVHVSRQAAVSAEASGGIGDVSVDGMSKNGKSYSTESYGKAKNSIRLDVKGGIGAIHISAE